MLKHFEDLVKKYQDNGLDVKVDRVDNEFIHCVLNLNDRFYLSATGDVDCDHLYAWRIGDVHRKSGAITEIAQIKEFMKILEK